ncbi:hypothetical protein [Janibacter melonis]|uniref:hypothetical protein n=1 Tax=Janibacter melonis TaxID=262209 RepID=UPI002095FB37|nr:hypothetical protein [Janibacter melonis]
MAVALGDPDELPWDQLELVDLGPAELRAKAAAVASHRSQVEPLGPGHGDGVLLGPHVRVRFERVVETIIRTTSLRVPARTGRERRGLRRDVRRRRRPVGLRVLVRAAQAGADARRAREGALRPGARPRLRDR